MGSCKFSNNIKSEHCIKLQVINQIDHKLVKEYDCIVEFAKYTDTIVFEYNASDSLSIFFDASLKFTQDKILLDLADLDFVQSANMKLNKLSITLEKYSYRPVHRDGYFIVYLDRTHGLYLIEDEVNYLVFVKEDMDVSRFLQEIEDVLL